MSIAVLCSHIPDPRMNKRIRSLSKIRKDITVIYWKRDFGYNYEFDQSPDVSHICLEAGKEESLLARLVENKELVRRSVNILESIVPKLVYVAGIECLPAVKKWKRKSDHLSVLEIADLPAMTHIEKFKAFSAIPEMLANRLVSSADFLVVTSPYYFSDYYHKKTRFTEKEVFLFENVPERAVFDGFTKQSHESFRVAFIGGVRFYDSIVTLFEAAKEIEGLEVVISGRGPDYQRIMEQSKEYPNVKITGGYNYKEDIAALYSDVDLVYSVYDTKRLNVRLALPNRLYEAIVCGIPIVVAKGTCLERYVNELGVGYSVEYRNVEELRSLLMHLKTFPKAMQEISNRESMIAERFFYENREKEFLSWISRLI